MRQVSNDYKNAIIDLGRQYDVKITYGNTTLTNEQLNEVTPHYRADLLKSVMKQLDLDSNVEIPIGTEINCQFGLKVGNNYEYIDYGNYIVYSSEKQEDLLSYRIVCYDKMLYAMKDYEDLEITYPISIKDYISAIATKIGLIFDDEDFTNADKEIPEEKYLDEDGNTLGYTYRDVLDELAQVTASIIKVENNKLRITYPDDVIAETSIFENTSGQITTDSKKVLDLEVEGNTYQEQTSGKNLFNLNATPSQIFNTSKTITDQTIAVSRDVGVTSTAYMSFELSLEPNIRYYVSGVVKVSNTDLTGAGGIYVRTDRGSGTVLGYQAIDRTITTNQNIGFSFVSPSNGIAFIWIYVDNSNTETSSTGTRTFTCTNLQVEKGSSATSYEKYTYGASPNPNYPQEIQVVTGGQHIQVSGKNLLDTNKMVTFQVPIANRWWWLDGRFANDQSTLYCKLEQGKRYTFSIKEKANFGQVQGIYRVDGVDRQAFLLQANETSCSFNALGTEVYVRGAVINANTDTYCICQLEEGSTATPFEEYKGRNHLIDLGRNLIDDSTIKGTISSTSSFARVVNMKVEPGVYLMGCYVDNELVYRDNIYSFSFRNQATGIVGSAYPNRPIIVTKEQAEQIDNVSIYFNTTFTTTYLNKQITGFMLTKDIELGEYSPPITPIELCKINDYKDSIKKSEGSNLFDRENASENKGLAWAYGTLFNETGSLTSDYIKVSIGDKYIQTYSSQVMFYDINKDYLGCLQSGGTTIAKTTGNTWASFTVPNVNDIYYMRLGYRVSVGGNQATLIDKSIMLNEGTTLLPYEPYLAKGKWYIEKNIKKANLPNLSVLNSGTVFGVACKFGVYTFGDQRYVGRNYYFYATDIHRADETFSNYGAYCNNYNFIVLVDSSTTLEDFNSKLSGTTVYYVLGTPTYTEITNQELISQLNSIELIDGLNNISITSANLSSPLKISYISEYETITEDYLKDTNVNFSEKVGPINSLVLSRSADSDLIYRKDDSSIERNGLTEIKISDNQILNGNDRDEYIDNIFNRLKGIEYYTNDYDSTGITYLDLGDFYKVEARGNRYLALMLNDELNVTQGFEELIHTDKPDTSVSDYKKADTTDRRLNQATLIVDKQNQTIQALTSRTSNLESKQINDKAELLAKFGDYALDSRVDDITTQVETLQTDTYTKTEVKSILKGTFYDSDNNQIVSEVVKTTSGTFDENGMHYEKTNAKTKSTINEVGVRVDNAINDSELMFAGYDDNINQTIVRTDNLTVRNHLVIGSQSRIQDYEENNELGTGVFDL